MDMNMFMAGGEANGREKGGVHMLEDAGKIESIAVRW